MKQVEDHNAPRWLALRYNTLVGAWFVVRTCPCHRGQSVSLPFSSVKRAERARARMLAVSRRLGMDKAAAGV
jgi:hypothetical protein